LLAKIDESSKIDLDHVEKYNDVTNNISLDLRSRESAVKCAPIYNPLDLIAAISKTHPVKHYCLLEGIKLGPPGKKENLPLNSSSPSRG